MKKVLLALAGVTIFTALLYFFPALYGMGKSVLVGIYMTGKGISIGAFNIGIWLVIAITAFFYLKRFSPFLINLIIGSGMTDDERRVLIDKMLFFGVLLPCPIMAVLTLFGALPTNFGYPFALFLFGLFLKGFGQVAHNRRAVVEVFGYRHNAVESGLRWKAPFFGSFILFPTTKVELELPFGTNKDSEHGFGIVTKRERMPSMKRVIAQTKSRVETSLQFEYPKGQALIKIAGKFPAPVLVPNMVPILENGVKVGEKQIGDKFDFSNVANFLEEPVGAAVRAKGSEKNYISLQQERDQFSADIHAILTTSIHGKPDSVIKELLIDEAEMSPDTIKLTIKHIHLPPNVVAAFDNEEAEALSLAGTKLKAEGTRITEYAKEKGIALGREERYAAAGATTFEEKRIIEALITQNGMAQGSSNTIVVPTDVFSALRGSGVGSGTTMNIADIVSLLGAATPAQRTQIAALLGITPPTTP